MVILLYVVEEIICSVEELSCLCNTLVLGIVKGSALGISASDVILYEIEILVDVIEVLKPLSLGGKVVDEIDTAYDLLCNLQSGNGIYKIVCRKVNLISLYKFSLSGWSGLVMRSISMRSD